MFVRHCQIEQHCPVQVEWSVIPTTTALLETRPIRHVYPTLSAQQHGGLGHGPDCIIAS